MKISVACIGNRDIEIEAHVFGDWAAHPGIDGDDLSERFDWWVVTHVPSGSTIHSSVGRLTEDEARQLASALGERLPRGLVPDRPRHAFTEVPLDIRKRIRSVIFDVRGEVLS